MLRINCLALACLGVLMPVLSANAASDNKEQVAAVDGGGVTTYYGKGAEPSGDPKSEAKPEAAPQSTEQPAAAEDSKSKSSEDTAKPAVVALPEPTLFANISLTDQRMTVTDASGKTLHVWPISSGTARHPTPPGTFRPQWASRMWYSRQYDWAPMPYAVFINGGVAVHGTPHVSRLGSPASHGCIRLATGNAKTFYNLVYKHGMKSVKVTVHGKPNFRGGGGDEVASRKPSKQQRAYANNDSGWPFSWGGSSESAAPAKKAKNGRNVLYYSEDGTIFKKTKSGKFVVVRPNKYPNKYGYGYGSGY